MLKLTTAEGVLVRRMQKVMDHTATDEALRLPTALWGQSALHLLYVTRPLTSDSRAASVTLKPTEFSK